jgi:hypothetical protein
MGMGIAIVMLQHSLEKGRYAKHIRYETVRKIRTAAFNVYHSSITGQGSSVMQRIQRNLRSQNVPHIWTSLNALIEVFIKVWVILCPQIGQFLMR